MRKYMLFIIIFSLFSCSKQVSIAPVESYQETEVAELSQDIITVEEVPVLVNTYTPPVLLKPETITMHNDENFILDDIIGTWWAGAPSHTLIIEFTDNNIFYIREYDYGLKFVGESFYPFKIEDDIIIENFAKDSTINYNIMRYFASPSIHISVLNDRVLDFKELPYRFYRGTIDELVDSRNTRILNRNRLQNFIIDELLNGVAYQGDNEDFDDIDGVINTYGIPLKDEITEVIDGGRYVGLGNLTGIREISYEDLLHRYYVFGNSGMIQCYVDVTLTKKVDRLTLINIGDTSDVVISTFGSYWHRDGEDIIYMWEENGNGPYRWARFNIEDDIITSISYILISWG